MEFSLIQDTASWDALASEWNELYNESYARVPFLRWSYLRSWWQTLGGGEWEPSQTQLAIITAREQGQLVGLAPFFLSTKEGFDPALRFLGSVEVSDYLDFLSLPERLNEFLVGLLAFIADCKTLPVKSLDLYNVMESSPTQSALPAACTQADWAFGTERLMPAPYIPLAESFEAYLATLDKKQRHEIRRKLRNAKARHQTNWYTVQDEDSLSAEVDAFIAMMHNDNRKAEFLQNPAMLQYLHDFAKAAFEDELLRLSFLTFDDHKAAAFLSLVTQQKLWIYNSAWEPTFASSSPGWVLLAMEIEWAISQGIREVDMMRGDEDYKYKFGAKDRFIMHTRCYPQAGI
ncbi:MAG TPA: hypothetical protein DCG78_04075 [Anaerolineaceae bacterium]|nr:hypothetical protein [Anaerolineaceae bacterium]